MSFFVISLRWGVGLTNGVDRSVLDFNPINTIASHMSYWADEDVSHFVLSQMLASKGRTTPRG